MYVNKFQVTGLQQGVHPDYGSDQSALPPQVERRPRRRRRPYSPDHADVVIGEAIGVQHDAGRLVPAGVIQLGGQVGIDPPRSVQSRGRQTRRDRLPPRPQPGRDGAVDRRQDSAARDVDIPVQHVVPGGQLISIELARCENFRTQKRHTTRTRRSSARFQASRT
ncbi:hypothetical protein H7H51_25670 [Mycolicibacterium farcinogenes]|nr:hypothetical protein [Mycolicibacterium farcinogenes]